MLRKSSQNIVEFSTIVDYVASIIRGKVSESGLPNKDIAQKCGFNEQYLSWVLGTRSTNNEGVYMKIAHAIGLSNKDFQQIKADAHLRYLREKYPEALEKEGMKYALSSDLGDNPDAIKEVKGFMDFVKQKYWIKK